jgi:hypothetical protein
MDFIAAIITNEKAAYLIGRVVLSVENSSRKKVLSK